MNIFFQSLNLFILHKMRLFIMLLWSKSNHSFPPQEENVYEATLREILVDKNIGILLNDRLLNIKMLVAKKRFFYLILQIFDFRLKSMYYLYTLNFDPSFDFVEKLHLWADSSKYIRQTEFIFKTSQYHISLWIFHLCLDVVPKQQLICVVLKRQFYISQQK